jgi:hypothetical protein
MIVADSVVIAHYLPNAGCVQIQSLLLGENCLEGPCVLRLITRSVHVVIYSAEEQGSTRQRSRERVSAVRM